jgi:PPK2 family polyphosphate:nucleotide phosphotransferase
MVSFRPYRVRPGRRVRLREWDTSGTQVLGRTEGQCKELLGRYESELARLQELLYANHKPRLLVVLQGQDTAGKDSTIRRVFRTVNPQGVTVARFGPPTPEELAHDFLWRVYPKLPGAGEIAIFNRSHYEDVLNVRVHRLVGKKVIKQRYREIVEFERTLVQEGTTVVKFFLHIDAAEQARRFRDRFRDPTKHWKFSLADLAELPHWDEYRSAYEEVLERTSTREAPWYVVPSDHLWVRDTIVSGVLIRTLKDLHLEYPRLDPAVARAIRRAPWAIRGSRANR